MTMHSGTFRNLETLKHIIMKQKITIKKTRELELKKSMLNVKIFSLMKKQLFSLVMVLALIVIGGTSAWAQDGLTVGTAYWHLPNSVHGVQVANHGATSTYAWTIRTAACDGSDNGVAVGASITTGAYQATITYTDAATGVYRITATEATVGDNLCSTVRVFYTAIMNIDVVVTASNAAGATIAGAALSTCNDYPSLNTPVGSSIVGNTDVLDNTNNLNTWQSLTWYNQRYVNVVLNTADLSGCPVAGAPAASAFAWQFQYVIAGNNYAAPDNFIAMQAAINLVGAGNVTYTDATSDASTITVDRGVTAFTIPLRSYIRWGLTNIDQDQDFTYTVNTGSAVLDGLNDVDLLYDDGTEPSDVAHTANNVSASQHIDASPATPRITIND
jgi:hypothetical protein